MKNRQRRVELIISLIANQSVGSQEELGRMLACHGHKVTQATLSRDLRALKTTKVLTEKGTYMYVLPNSNCIKDKTLAASQYGYAAQPKDFVSVIFSGNMAVIKTRNGYAAALAYDIDMAELPEVLGTIPGADTIFAVIREGVSHRQALEAFSSVLPVDPELIKAASDLPDSQDT